MDKVNCCVWLADDDAPTLDLMDNCNTKYTFVETPALGSHDLAGEPAGSFETSFTGLSPNTNYEVYCAQYANNTDLDAGNGILARPIAFETAGQSRGPCPTPA